VRSHQAATVIAKTVLVVLDFHKWIGMEFVGLS
jgi:hypothetical protein